MSNLERDPRESRAGGPAAVAEQPVHELLEGRDVMLGPRGTLVTRTLPNKDRRMVGAWCFVDHYGPEDTTGTLGMHVPPHPHTGLQTVSWLVEGDVLHRDSLGSLQLIRPGQLNLMTAGRGIAHSEESPADRPARLHGVQLWVALPHGDRWGDPHFEHHGDLPGFSAGGVDVTVVMGELADAASPARAYSPLVGAEAVLGAGSSIELPLRPDFEYAALTLAGTVVVDGEPLGRGPMLYLGTGRATLQLAAAVPGRLLLLGGEPFAEQLVMWWNFVGRSHEEIVRMREEWMSGSAFGDVHGYAGDPLPAPPMPTSPLRPRGRRRA